MLVNRDRQTLAYLAKFRFLERRQLQQLLFGDTGVQQRSAVVMTQRILHRLNLRKLVAHTARQLGGPTGGSVAPVYYLTPTGARLLTDTRDAPRAPRSMLLVHHAVATADVVLGFDRAAHAHARHELLSWATDRDVGRDLGPLPALPDLYVVYGTADTELHALIEVDLGTEGSRVIANKINQYLSMWRTGTINERLGLWPVVLFVTTTATRARYLARIVEQAIRTQPDADRVRAGTEFAVTTIDELTESGVLAPVWVIVGRSGRHPLLPTDHEVSS